MTWLIWEKAEALISHEIKSHMCAHIYSAESVVCVCVYSISHAGAEMCLDVKTADWIRRQTYQQWC